MHLDANIKMQLAMHRANYNYPYYQCHPQVMGSRKYEFFKCEKVVFVDDSSHQ